MPPDYTKSNNVQNGLLFGVIIGLVYCVSIYLRYNLSSGIILVAVITFLFYLLVLGLVFYCGIKRRKELGGFITLKDAFQTIFIAILVAEFIYVVFNIIYLKFIDPGYFDKFMASMETFFEKTIKDETKRDEALEKFRERMDDQKNKGLTFKGIASSYLISVAITGVFGFLASLIIRKNKPVFNLEDNKL